MSQEQFARYLYQGLGRTYLWLQEHDAAPYSQLLLYACLHDHLYDRQSEGSRAAYLYELIQLTSTPHSFCQQILEALANPDADMDVEQLFDFALIYARNGDAAARRLLYQQCATYARQGEFTGAEHVIALDGTPGFLFVAEQLGAALQAGCEVWDDDYLLARLREVDEAASLAELRSLAQAAHPAAVLYIDAVAAALEQPEPSLSLRGKPYSEIKAAIERGEQPALSHRLGHWGEHAPDAELRLAADDLLRQTDEGHMYLQLSIFQRRPLPLGADFLLPLVQHSNQDLVWLSFSALAQLHDPRIRELALELIEEHRSMQDEPWQLREALDLLVHNYQPEDAALLQDIVAETTDDVALHILVSSISAILKQHPTPAARALLLDIYERGACSICRHHAIERLIEIEAVPGWMSREAPHDSNKAIREAMEEYGR